MKKSENFNPEQIDVVNDAVAMGEELVNNFYKMSSTQWLHSRYDIKTLIDLEHNEVLDGHFAQVIKYCGVPGNRQLSSSVYDFYKICFQDHTILATLKLHPEMKLFPLSLYIITHELIHIVRFCRFLQNFEASPAETLTEETIVHRRTHKILHPVNVAGLEHIFNFYQRWRD